MLKKQCQGRTGSPQPPNPRHTTAAPTPWAHTPHTDSVGGGLGSTQAFDAWRQPNRRANNYHKQRRGFRSLQAILDRNEKNLNRRKTQRQGQRLRALWARDPTLALQKPSKIWHKPTSMTAGRTFSTQAQRKKNGNSEISIRSPP